MSKTLYFLLYISLYIFGYLYTTKTALAQANFLVDINANNNSLFERVDLEQTLLQTCRANKEIASESNLSVKGKGGTLLTPELPLDSHNIYIDGQINSNSTVSEPIETSQKKVYPARGIKITESGEIILTAYQTNNSRKRISEVSRDCS